MKFFAPLCMLCLFLLCVSVYAQDTTSIFNKGKNDTIRVAVTKVDGEMIPWLPLDQVNIYGKRVFGSSAQRMDYNRLRYNVLKVLPYAIYARNRYAQLQRDLSLTGDRREQKRLVKVCEQEIKEKFNKDIKNMTITQGEILIKLIDRETGNSSYDLVRELRGGVTAFFYQSVARVFGHDLKEKYDPQRERDIENIIQTAGYYNMYN
ncbi:DUF4294 domain-containing protein [Pedobacter sp. BS3]|uniref:DUF4294 domain-containing protein n=1 Tax=Pedobacter sp. BS3 TaxID=2567937 RepID=UPI0011EFCFE6|nr:DUF4294 domain-containing protein [Pedobacter sp. BS3]TZF83807.1 DUF4294 domain-containing protein [Pedobacter sp. BS3]